MKIVLQKEIALELTPEEIAEWVGEGDDKFQADFFNELAKIFAAYGKGNGDKDGYQMLFINDHLSEEGRAFIQKFAEYIKGESKT